MTDYCPHCKRQTEQTSNSSHECYSMTRRAVCHECRNSFVIMVLYNEPQHKPKQEATDGSKI